MLQQYFLQPKLIRCNWKMDGAKYGAIWGDNLLDAKIN